MYSLFMACTVCQGETVQRWSFWEQNCEAVYVTQYPLDIPAGTAVPHWAYLNVTTTDIWDAAAASAVANLPESTGVTPQVSTLTSSTSISRTSTRTGSLLSTNTSQSSHGGGGSNAGAIAGGVVGGLAVIGLTAAVVLWFLMKKKKRSEVPPSSSEYINSYPPPNNYPKYEQQPGSPGPTPSQQMTTYNTSDPTTFPVPLLDHTSAGATTYPQTLYDPHAPRRGQYSGAPEV